MKPKSVKFLRELHRRLHELRRASRSTFIFAESLDDFCLTLGYASAIAAYDDLPGDIREYVHLSHNKANPMIYAHVAFISTPPDVLFTELSGPDAGGVTLIMNLTLTDTVIEHLYRSYV